MRAGEAFFDAKNDPENDAFSGAPTVRFVRCFRVGNMIEIIV
jgi:hypothetical protein